MKKAFTLIAFLLAASICCAQESRTYQSASITVAGQFVTENSLNQVSPVTAGATSGVIGIATTSGPGVNLPVTVKWLGPAIASMDGACTVGQFITISTTINGDGHCQSGLPTSTQALGIAEQNATGVVSILITPLSAQQTGSSGSMTWPAAAGIAVYAGGNAWGTSLTAPSSTIVGISDTQTLTNKSIAGSEVNSGTVPVAQIPTAIPIASVGSAGLSATLPIAITSAGAISTTSIAGFRFGNASAADTVATAAQAATLIQGLTGCNTATYVFTPQASDCVAPSGGAAWSAITNPTGNLALTMGSDTSTFTYSSALAAAFELANNTAATSSVSQPSPFQELCGQGWEGASPANATDCVKWNWNIPNGANTAPAFTMTPVTSTTNSNVNFVLASPFTQLQIGGSSGALINNNSVTGAVNTNFTVYGSGNTTSLFLSPGSQSGANAQGTIQVRQSYFTASALSNAFEVVCGTTTAWEVAACAAGANNIIGIALTIGGTSTQLFIAAPGSQSTVIFDGTPTLGDVVCSPPTSTGTTGLAHDNGTTACTLGENLGVVIASVSGTGSGATATVALR